jgi:FixJ family two-component response regulator
MNLPSTFRIEERRRPRPNNCHRSSCGKLEGSNLSAHKVVFVVDDDPGMLKGLERLLKTHGFDVELFESAEEFNKRANFCNAICLVLDINLNGKSGIELKRQLAASGVSLPVIFITASDSDVTRKAALDVGCVAYLTKPFSAKSLMDAIEQASA